MGDWFEKASMGALVDSAAARFGDRQALYYEGRRWSFADLKTETDRVAKGLLALGIQSGEKVSLWMPNRPEWISALFAVMKIGAILVPINTRFRTADLEYVVRQSESSTLITVDRAGPVRFGEMVCELCPDLHQSDPNHVRQRCSPISSASSSSENSGWLARTPGQICWPTVKSSPMLRLQSAKALWILMPPP